MFDVTTDAHVEQVSHIRKFGNIKWNYWILKSLYRFYYFRIGMRKWIIETITNQFRRGRLGHTEYRQSNMAGIHSGIKSTSCIYSFKWN